MLSSNKFVLIIINYVSIIFGCLMVTSYFYDINFIFTGLNNLYLGITCLLFSLLMTILIISLNMKKNKKQDKENNKDSDENIKKINSNDLNCSKINKEILIEQSKNISNVEENIKEDNMIFNINLNYNGDDNMTINEQLMLDGSDEVVVEEVSNIENLQLNISDDILQRTSSIKVIDSDENDAFLEPESIPEITGVIPNAPKKEYKDTIQFIFLNIGKQITDSFEIITNRYKEETINNVPIDTKKFRVIKTGKDNFSTRINNENVNNKSTTQTNERFQFTITTTTPKIQTVKENFSSHNDEEYVEYDKKDPIVTLLTCILVFLIIVLGLVAVFYFKKTRG